MGVVVREVKKNPDIWGAVVIPLLGLERGAIGCRQSRKWAGNIISSEPATQKNWKVLEKGVGYSIV